jgi:two-component system NtrC family sensor kinase
MRPVARLLVLALVIGLLAVAEVWRSYQQATSTAERHAAGVTHLLAEQAERSIQAIDLALIGLSDTLTLPPSRPPNDPAFLEAMKHRLKRLPYVRALFVVGADGFIVHHTHHPGTPNLNVGDRPYFLVHRKEDGGALHIGQPLRSKRGGIWFVSVSRRITNPDGSFGGVVVAAAEPRYFKVFYEELSIGDANLIALILRDGTLLASTPDHDETIGTSFAGIPARNLALDRGSGVVWTTSPIDGVRRLVGYRTLAGGSVVVLAGWSESWIYESWCEHATVVGGGSALVWLLTAGLAMILLKYRRREEAEQARLAQSRRLETIGRIAGGIAHDLGNTVKIARTTFTLLKPSLASQRDAIALVEDADRSLKSAFEIIDCLLAFARRRELSPRPTDLAKLISGFAPMLRQAAGPRIELNLDIARPLVSSIDPIHLESALLNLVLNSKDAMTGGGHIVIALREAQPPRTRDRTRGVASANSRWAEIAVKDDGAGMSREVLERAFEPFFTTRSGGSGLGLGQVLGFVQQSAGEVRIESGEGSGTTVCLLFPAASDSAKPARS